MTTSDFLRAAGAPPSTASAPPQAATGATAFYASGQSQPDDDETLPRSKGEELEASGGDGSGPHNSATAAWKAPRPTAPRSVVLIAPQRAEVAVVRSRADASLPVTARADAQLPAPVSPANRAAVVSSGFGPEVDIATDGPVAKASPARRTKPAPAPVARNTPPPVSSLPVAERDAITDAAMRPVVLPTIYSRNGRVLLPAPLKGSREVLVHQNTMADADGLERIESEAQLNEMRASGLLIGFPETAALHVNDELPASHRTARPWTVHFANDIARRFYDRFRQPLIVTSAVRTIDYQLRLERVNGNAAGIEGATASPHLTGQALDLAKGRMNAAELAWMRAYLLPLMRAGLIDVEEEFQQSCFHISVYRRYAPAVRRAAAPVFKAETRAARVPADTAEDEER